MFQSILGPIFGPLGPILSNTSKRGAKRLLRTGPIGTKIGPKCSQITYFVVSEGLLKTVLGVHFEKGFCPFGVCKVRSERHIQNSLRTPINIV